MSGNRHFKLVKKSSLWKYRGTFEVWSSITNFMGHTFMAALQPFNRKLKVKF